MTKRNNNIVRCTKIEISDFVFFFFLLMEKCIRRPIGFDQKQDVTVDNVSSHVNLTTLATEPSYCPRWTNDIHEKNKRRYFSFFLPGCAISLIRPLNLTEFFSLNAHKSIRVWIRKSFSVLDKIINARDDDEHKICFNETRRTHPPSYPSWRRRRKRYRKKMCIV